MRYGKVYFYDRMGNRLTHQMPGGRVEEESITSMFRSPQPGHIKLSSGVSSITRVHDAYHPDYPFKPNFMALEESEMDFAEGGVEPPSAETNAQMSAKRVLQMRDTNPWDALMDGVEDELKYEMPTTSKVLKPIISPLNSLRSPPDSNELEQERLAKELAHMDLKVSKVLEEKDWDEHIQDFNLRHSVLEIDSNSLCSMCRMEENAVDESKEINNLRKKLAEHVDDVNLIESAQHERELLSAEKDEMPVLPAFGNQNNIEEEKNREGKDKERYREELEIQIENKRRLSLFEEDKERKIQNAVNVLDAQKYAEDQNRIKALELIEKQKHYQDLREQIEVKDFIRKEEEFKQEWWEKKPPFTHAINDEKDKGRMFEQLRRHEALKESVLMLEDFKKQQKEQDEAARLAHQKQQYYLKHSLQHQASLISHGTGKRSTAEQTNPEVYRAWEEAHRENDRRYRVLQEVDTSGMSGTTATAVVGPRRSAPSIMPPAKQHYEETFVERKRCRKCHRPMRQRKYTSVLDRQMKF